MYEGGQEQVAGAILGQYSPNAFFTPTPTVVRQENRSVYVAKNGNGTYNVNASKSTTVDGRTDSVSFSKVVDSEEEVQRLLEGF